MSTQWWTAPKITVLAAPAFVMPEHWPIQWPEGNTASDAESLVEYAGRLCYLSQHNPAQRTSAEYLANVMSQGHGSVLEHASISLLIEGISRSLTHELVRHRAGTAISQVSQRFVDESDCDFVVPPLLLQPEALPLYAAWQTQCLQALQSYSQLVEALLTDPRILELPSTLRRKRARECARAVLPNCTETKVVWTANLRALRHVLTLRGDVHADLEIHRLAQAIWSAVSPYAPAVFADFHQSEDGSLIPAYPKV